MRCAHVLCTAMAAAVFALKPAYGQELAPENTLTVTGADDVRASTSVQRGRWENKQVHSQSLEGALLAPPTTRTISVYLPAAYDDFPDAEFPVLYLLHPWWMNHLGFINKLGGQPTFDAFFSQEGMRPMIVVFPNGYYQYKGTWFNNSDVAGNWEDFITKDLVPYIDATYDAIPDSSGRGISGANTGGYAAITMGMKHPDIFRAAYGLAPAELVFEEIFLNQFRQDLVDAASRLASSSYPGFGQLPVYEQVAISACVAFGPDAAASPEPCRLPVDADGELIQDAWEQWLEHDPYTLLSEPEYADNLRNLAALGFDCGTDAWATIKADSLFSQALKVAEIQHDFRVFSGNELDGLSGRLRDHVLPLFSEALSGAVVTAVEDDLLVPDRHQLFQNYPNPFNPTTTISYALPRPAEATLSVIDLLGRQLRVLASGTQPAGSYEVTFDAAGLPSGVYLYRLEAGDFVETKSLILAK